MKELIYAVHSSEIGDYLERLGLKDELNAGNIRCTCCQATISAENFGAVARLNNKYIFSCNNESCQLSLAALSKGKKQCS